LALGPLLRGLEIIQVAVVVRDLEAYATRQSGLLGNGPWRVFDFGPHMMTRPTATGAGSSPYLDTQSQLGMILEVIEPPTGLGEPIRRL
jgi:hypothetical protein